MVQLSRSFPSLLFGDIYILEVFFLSLSVERIRSIDHMTWKKIETVCVWQIQYTIYNREKIITALILIIEILQTETTHKYF